jgi:GT2 family glycosyltransferase
MIRREALNDVGLLDEDFFMYSEDVDYCKRSWERNWEIVYFPEVNAIHYGAVSSSHFPVRFNVEMLKANLQYWRKQHSRRAARAFWGISLLHQVRKICQGMVFYLTHSSQEERISMDIRASVACLVWLLGISSSQLPQPLARRPQ